MALSRQQALHNLTILMEFLNCSGTYYLTAIDPMTQEIVKSQIHYQPVINILESGGQKEYVTKSIYEENCALVLWSKLDLMWLCALSDFYDSANYIFILGPVCTTEANRETIRQNLKATYLSDVNEKELEDFIVSLPRLSYGNLFDYERMFYYAATGEKIATKSIHFQQSTLHESASTVYQSGEERTQDILFINRLKESIRTGNFNDSSFMNYSLVHRGLHIHTNQLTHAKATAISLISIAMDTAILSGVMPETAYQTGERYIEMILQKCETPADISLRATTVFQELAKLVSFHQNKNFSKVVRHCCEYIQANTLGKVDLDILSRQLGYSKYYITKRFQTETGISILSYIQQKKISHAIELLTHGNQKIESIAAQMGFSSPAYFSRVFKKVTGQSPHQYRNCQNDL